MKIIHKTTGISKSWSKQDRWSFLWGEADKACWLYRRMCDSEKVNVVRGKFIRELGLEWYREWQSSYEKYIWEIIQKEKKQQHKLYFFKIIKKFLKWKWLSEEAEILDLGQGCHGPLDMAGPLQERRLVMVSMAVVVGVDGNKLRQEPFLEGGNTRRFLHENHSQKNRRIQVQNSRRC